MKNNKKGIIIGAIIFAVLIAAFAAIYYINRPAVSKGAKSIVIEVKGSSGDIKDYDLSTDAEYLRQAMDELAGNGSGFSYSGADGEYGLMVEFVDGERADYSKDKAYWALYVNGEYGQYGADSQPVADGDTFTWVYEVEK